MKSTLFCILVERVMVCFWCSEVGRMERGAQLTMAEQRLQVWHCKTRVVAPPCPPTARVCTHARTHVHTPTPTPPLICPSHPHTHPYKHTQPCCYPLSLWLCKGAEAALEAAQQGATPPWPHHPKTPPSFHLFIRFFLCRRQRRRWRRRSRTRRSASRARCWTSRPKCRWFSCFVCFYPLSVCVCVFLSAAGC